MPLSPCIKEEIENCHTKYIFVAVSQREGGGTSKAWIENQRIVYTSAQRHNKNKQVPITTERHAPVKIGAYSSVALAAAAFSSFPILFLSDKNGTKRLIN